MRRLSLLPVSLLLGCMAPMAVSAQALTPLDRYWVAVGVYHSDNNLNIRVDGEDTVEGTNVSFQEDLGLGDEELAFVYDVGVTLGRNHQIAVTGHRYDNSAHNTLERELDINDESYAVGAAFKGNMEVETTAVSYTWFLFRNDEHTAFGLGLGAVHYSLGVDLAATATVDNEGVPGTVEVGMDFHDSAWLPMVRAQYTRVINDQWRWNVELAGVRKGSGSVTGRAVDASVSVDYFPWKNFGFTLQYSYDDIRLDYEKSNYRGKLDLINQGPQIKAVVKF